MFFSNPFGRRITHRRPTYRRRNARVVNPFFEDFFNTNDNVLSLTGDFFRPRNACANGRCSCKAENRMQLEKVAEPTENKNNTMLDLFDNFGKNFFDSEDPFFKLDKEAKSFNKSMFESTFVDKDGKTTKTTEKRMTGPDGVTNVYKAVTDPEGKTNVEEKKFEKGEVMEV